MSAPNHPCDCCATPDCPSVSIQWESRAASKAKCGHSEFPGFASTPPKRYLVATQVIAAFESEECTSIPPFDADEIESREYSGECVNTINPANCVSTVTGSGQVVITYCDGNSETVTLNCGTALGCDEYQSATTCVQDYASLSGPAPYSTTTLSDEYTTSLLMSNTAAALPAWDNDWNDTAGSLRNLTTDELNYSIRESKWRLRHAPSGTCYLKVWLREKFTPATGDPTYTNLDPYIWQGTGNPCVSDPTKHPSHSDNMITGPENTLVIPTTNGTVTVEVLKYSCVEGYEPGEGEPNGYPA